MRDLFLGIFLLLPLGCAAELEPDPRPVPLHPSAEDLGTTSSSPEELPCGGFANVACPDDQVCVDDPSDDCDPDSNNYDCGGFCVMPESLFCGGFANVACPDGLVCVDDPSDDCDPDSNNYDCGGFCSAPEDGV